jgi:DNA topoisomerase VI subunit B
MRQPTDADLRRRTFRTSRELDFFSVEGLALQIGFPPQRWAIALAKELIDNGLDGSENAGRPPRIEIVVQADSVSVRDNGQGLPLATLNGALDYTVRVSDKAFYVSPTRGQLGNALKCVFAAPFVASDEKGGWVEVETKGRRHRIEVDLDRIAQTVRLEDTTEESGFVQNGTFVKMCWPGIASCLTAAGRCDLYNTDNLPEDNLDEEFDEIPGPFSVERLVRAYASFNPHASFQVTGPDGFTLGVPASNPHWKKWSPRDPTSPHWYDLERFVALVEANLAEENSGARRRTVRDFVSEFNGLKRSNAQKAVTDRARLSGEYLQDLVRDGSVDADRAGRLLEAMKAIARRVKPKALAILGKEHLLNTLERHFGVDPESVRYRMSSPTQSYADGMPFVLEMAMGIRNRESEHQGREILVGLNWSPTLRLPSEELIELLWENRVDREDPVVVVVHLAFLRLEVTDHGKSTLATLPEAIRESMEKCGTSVLREWKKAKVRADQEGRVRQQELQELRRALRKRVLTVKEAAYRAMEQAYMETSNGGEYPANARQIMYKARPLVLELTGGKCWKQSSTFTQHHLPNFMRENPGLTDKWDVVYDARGRLVEPHTAKRIDLGTIPVRQYIGHWKELTGDDKPRLRIDSACPTLGPQGRYAFALFIEKEGFAPLLDKAAFASRYDLAIMSTKGMSVTAARALVERLSEQGVTVLVLRDFDKSGFSIVHTLRDDTRRYQFRSRPKVNDLGLRLEDVNGPMQLTSEPVEYRRGQKKISPVTDPRVRLRECGATEEECEFLVRERTSYGWLGERVELNAMSSAQFIQFLEGKLADVGVRKVIPDGPPLPNAYRRALEIALLNRSITELAESVHAQAQRFEVPPDLRARVADRLAEEPTLSWDQALAELAGEKLG